MKLRSLAFTLMLSCMALHGVWLFLSSAAAAETDSSPVIEEEAFGESGDMAGAMHLSPEAKVVNMTLTEAVQLSVRRNVQVQREYLTRITQKYSLEEEEAKFIPNVNLDGTASFGVSGAYQDTYGSSKSSSSTQSSKLAISPNVVQKIPTGGEFTFTWANSRTRSLSLGADSSDSVDSTSSWLLKFTQPLLKDGGYDYNMASVRIARINEQSNILSLRDSISSVVSSAISYYYALYRNFRLVQIAQASLERSRKLLEQNRVRIEMGRMAANDIYESESDVANQELSVETALNDLDAARLVLLDHLELDRSMYIIPVERIQLEPQNPDYNECLALAKRNNKDYLGTVYAEETQEINLLQVKNQRMWNLSLTGQYGEDYTGLAPGDDYKKNGWEAGVELSAPVKLFGRDAIARDKALVDAKVSLRRAQINLHKAELDLGTSIQNKVRNVYTQLKQVNQAKRSVDLARKKLEVEQVRMQVGRSTNFKVVSYQNDLVSAQQTEVNRIISYVSALTELDQALGLTLDTWRIEFVTQDEKLLKEMEVHEWGYF
ncbi:MAG: outer membrane protein [Desulfovibrionales bacterium]|jgi:outer membrane protein TolC|nr:outer membrane protein [Desulfovibrionales bacterium]